MDKIRKCVLANKIMNVMIDRYSKNGFNESNITLMVLLRIQDEVSKLNWKIIAKVIKHYGPVAGLTDGEESEKAKYKNLDTKKINDQHLKGAIRQQDQEHFRDL